MQDASAVSNRPTEEGIAEPASPAAGEKETKKLLSPLLEAVMRPIPGENPCGREIIYDDDYLSLKGGIDRLAGVGVAIDQSRVTEGAKQLQALAGKSEKERKDLGAGSIGSGGSFSGNADRADYSNMIDMATDILGARSKDFRVAGFLAVALLRGRGLAGAVEAINVFVILTREYWTGAFPAVSRTQARKAALEFMVSHLVDDLKDYVLGAGDYGILETAKDACTELHTELSAKSPEAATGVLLLSRTVSDCLARAPKPKPVVSTPPAGGEASSTSSRGGVTTAGGQPSGDRDLTSDQEVLELLRRSAAYLRSQDRTSALAVKLIRAARWEKQIQAPPNDNGKTKLEAPPAARRQFLLGLHQSAQWEKLIDEAEIVFLQSPFHFWLDLQRFVGTAMEASGPGFSQARLVLLRELAALVERVPGLPALFFADGTPFALPATQAWIQETVSAASAAGGMRGDQRMSPAGSGLIEEAYQKAKGIADKGDVAAAVEILEDPKIGDGSRRTEFLRRHREALLCLRANQPALARPALEALCEEIDRYVLAAWEPRMAVDVWNALHQCYATLGATAPSSSAKQLYQEKAGLILDKICQVDMRFALQSAGLRAASSGPQTERIIPTMGIAPVGKERASPDRQNS